MSQRTWGVGGFGFTHARQSAAKVPRCIRSVWAEDDVHPYNFGDYLVLLRMYFWMSTFVYYYRRLDYSCSIIPDDESTGPLVRKT